MCEWFLFMDVVDIVFGKSLHMYMIRMLKGLQDVVLFQSTYLQVRLLQTILFATCTKYRIIFCGWVVGCPSFFYFFSLKKYK